MALTQEEMNAEAPGNPFISGEPLDERFARLSDKARGLGASEEDIQGVSSQFSQGSEELISLDPQVPQALINPDPQVSKDPGELINPDPQGTNVLLDSPTPDFTLPEPSPEVDDLAAIQNSGSAISVSESIDDPGIADPVTADNLEGITKDSIPQENWTPAQNARYFALQYNSPGEAMTEGSEVTPSKTEEVRVPGPDATVEELTEFWAKEAEANLPKTEGPYSPEEQADILAEAEEPWTTAGESIHTMRQGLTGLTAVPDIMLSMISLLEFAGKSDETAPFISPMELPLSSPMAPVLGVILNHDQARAVLRNTVHDLGELAGISLKEGFSVSGLFNRVVPQTQAQTRMGRYAGHFVQGAVEGVAVMGRLATLARKGKVDDVPDFLKPFMKELQKNPKKILTVEGVSGAFAALGSVVALDFYLENYAPVDTGDNRDVVDSFARDQDTRDTRDTQDTQGTTLDDDDDSDALLGPSKETTALVVALVGSVIGGGVPRIAPMGTPLAVSGAKSIAVVGGAVRSGSNKMRAVTREYINERPQLAQAFNDNWTLRVFKKAGNMVAGPNIDNTLPQGPEAFDQVLSSNIKREWIDGMMGSLDFQGNFAEGFKKAAVMQGEMPGLMVRSSNLTDSAVKSGIPQIHSDLDRMAYLKDSMESVDVVTNYITKKFKEGSPGEVEQLKVFSRNVQAQAALDMNVILQARGQLFDDIYHQSVGGKSLQSSGKEMRQTLKGLKNLFEKNKRLLYDTIDPANDITLDINEFTSLSKAMADPTLDTPGIKLVRKAYGNALYDTLALRKEKGTVNITLKELEKIKSGDVRAIAKLKPSLRQVRYTDLNSLVKKIYKAGQNVRETTVGGGDDFNTINELLRSTKDNFNTSLRSNGYQEAALQRTTADNFYKEYLANQFDPKLTLAGKMLDEKNSGLFAVKESYELET